MARVERCSRPVALTPQTAQYRNSYPRHVVLYTEGQRNGVGLAANGVLDAILGGPGKFVTENPYGRNGELKPAFTCELVSEDPCVERCVRARTKDRPPKYGLLNGENCASWADKTLEACRRKCGG